MTYEKWSRQIQDIADEFAGNGKPDVFWWNKNFAADRKRSATHNEQVLLSNFKEVPCWSSSYIWPWFSVRPPADSVVNQTHSGRHWRLSLRVTRVVGLGPELERIFCENC